MLCLVKENIEITELCQNKSPTLLLWVYLYILQILNSKSIHKATTQSKQLRPISSLNDRASSCIYFYNTFPWRAFILSYLLWFSQILGVATAMQVCWTDAVPTRTHS